MYVPLMGHFLEKVTSGSHLCGRELGPEGKLFVLTTFDLEFRLNKVVISSFIISSYKSRNFEF